jgi:hypothetical protein
VACEQDAATGRPEELLLQPEPEPEPEPEPALVSDEASTRPAPPPTASALLRRQVLDLDLASTLWHHCVCVSSRS